MLIINIKNHVAVGMKAKSLSLKSADAPALTVCLIQTPHRHNSRPTHFLSVLVKLRGSLSLAFISGSCTANMTAVWDGFHPTRIVVPTPLFDTWIHLLFIFSYCYFLLRFPFFGLLLPLISYFIKSFTNTFNFTILFLLF